MAKVQHKGLTVKKEEDISKWFTEVLTKAELTDYTDVSGCIVFRPYVFEMWETIVEEVNKRIKSMGYKNMYFPMFIPEKHLCKEAEHVEGFAPEVAWVTHAGNSELPERLAVRPTSETIMYPTYSKWIRSWRDLPLKLNQWSNVVRWEFNNPVPLMRTREFIFNEGHTVYATKKEAEAEKEPIINMYLEVMKDVMAIYGSQGLKSEKEKFAGAEYTCSIESFLPNGKAIQGPDFHHDGQNFAKAYDIKFKNKNDEVEYAWQNTWAISTRMLGVMILMHGDDNGLILPPPIAPIQTVIVPILRPDSKDKVLDACDKIKKDLESKEIRVHIDDREKQSPGEKFNEWELKGVPVRIELGPRDLEENKVMIARRDTLEKEEISISDILDKTSNILSEIHNKLYDKSKKLFDDNVVEVSNLDELKKVISDKKMALAPFCNCPECEDYMKEETGGAGTRNQPDNVKVPKGAKCVRCDKPATTMIYIAKSY